MKERNMLDNIINFNAALNETAFPELDKCNFTAQHGPLNYTPEGFDQPVELPKSIAQVVYRTDTGEPLGRTGGRYGIAQNTDVQDVLVEALERALPSNYLKGIELKEETSNNGGFSKFTYTFPSAAEPIRQLRDATGYAADRYGEKHKETWLNMSFSMINSFDGSTPLILQNEVIDVSCANSLTTGYMDTSKMRHSTKIDPSMFTDWITEQAGNFKQRIDVFNQWAARSITPEQAEQTLLDAGLSPRLTKQMLEQFELECDRRGRSVWSLASSMTFWSSHSSEKFTVRGSKDSDNVAKCLHNRQGQVLKVMNSEAWSEIARAA
jgi:hypothetical protein